MKRKNLKKKSQNYKINIWTNGSSKVSSIPRVFVTLCGVLHLPAGLVVPGPALPPATLLPSGPHAPDQRQDGRRQDPGERSPEPSAGGAHGEMSCPPLGHLWPPHGWRSADLSLFLFYFVVVFSLLYEGPREDASAGPQTEISDRQTGPHGRHRQFA